MQQQGKHSFARKNKRIVFLGLVICFLFLLAFVVVQNIKANPDIIFLSPEGKARWIRYAMPISLYPHPPEDVTVIFKSSFQVNTPPSSAPLHLRALKRASVFLDNRLLFSSHKDLNRWKEEYVIDLSPGLSPGLHELRIEVFNRKGHPALLAYCRPLNVYTGEAWDSTYDGQPWEKALPVDKTLIAPISQQFERADHALLSGWWCFLPLFMVVFCYSFLISRGTIPTQYVPTARAVRWFVLAAWVTLAANNFLKIPLYVGLDNEGHLKYIEYLILNHRIPLPSEGWQMFQPPLFYSIAAFFAKFLLTFFSAETVALLIRIIPLLCGMAQVEICYRAMVLVFPEREGLQAIGTIIGGLLPMNIYISQVVGNEPIAGFFTGLVVLLIIRHLYHPSGRNLEFFGIGLFWGAALLSKITAVLLFFPIVVSLSVSHFKGASLSGERLLSFGRRVAQVTGIAALISGWYYIYVWIRTGGIPFPTSSISAEWWQDPSYRIAKHFLSFGESLFYPVYSGVVGIWDSLYSTLWMDGFLSGVVSYNDRPPWNYGFMLACSWLSLLPTAAILLGIIYALRKPGRRRGIGLFLAGFCVLIYASAIFYVYLILPTYSTGKATYALGITVCFAILCVQGLDLMMRKPVIRFAVYGIVACWAVSVYVGYFV